MEADRLTLELARIGVDWRILTVLGIALALMIVGAIATVLQRRTRSRSRLRPQGTPPPSTEPTEETLESAFSRPALPVLSLRAELLERRPLSEAQWDSPVPAAWTIFRLTTDDDDTMQLGLLLPVQHVEAYSAAFVERCEGANAERLLGRLSKALGGAIPGTAIEGSDTGFLELKTYVRNESPDIIPGSLDLSLANYWISTKLFAQDRLELFLRVNAGAQKAEIAAARATRPDELMRVFAATLRPASGAQG
ncbi:MAG: hypothetical protein EB084_00330 [Proteobacteria bacterium]|nr:hypothetical protein [Pseudomonadota bacterium]